MIELPKSPSKIGVFVSGGLDSAILYYLIVEANRTQNHSIIPITLVKNQNSLHYAQTVINYVHLSLKIDPVAATILDGKDIVQAVTQAYQQGLNRVYVGLIKELPEFLVGWKPSARPETKFCKMPFKDLTKVDLVQLVLDKKQENLFLITHSCATESTGRCNVCNRCRERKWAFESLALSDPGVL